MENNVATAALFVSTLGITEKIFISFITGDRNLVGYIECFLRIDFYLRGLLLCPLICEIVSQREITHIYKLK